MKTLFLALLLTFPAVAQQLPDISKFVFIGNDKDKLISAFVEPGTRDNEFILFRGMISRNVGTDGERILSDPNNFSISVIYANCSTHSFAFRETKGVSNGKSYSETYPPNTNIADKGSIMYAAIERVCKPPEMPKGKEGK